MYIEEIAGFVVVVIFIIYFSFVRMELKMNNDIIDRLRKDIEERNKLIFTEVEALFSEIRENWNHESRSYDEIPSKIEETLVRILTDAAQKKIDGEPFIDEIIKRINNKQLN